MKKKIEIVAFLAMCVIVVTFAIKAGQHHKNCQQCNLAVKIK